MTTGDLLEDVEFPLGVSESPLMIAEVVGRRADAIAKLAERHGKPEIARVFWAVASAEQRRRLQQSSAA